MLFKLTACHQNQTTRFLFFIQLTENMIGRSWADSECKWQRTKQWSGHSTGKVKVQVDRKAQPAPAACCTRPCNCLDSSRCLWHLGPNNVCVFWLVYLGMSQNAGIVLIPGWNHSSAMDFVAVFLDKHGSLKQLSGAEQGCPSCLWNACEELGLVPLYGHLEEDSITSSVWWLQAIYKRARGLYLYVGQVE